MEENSYYLVAQYLLGAYEVVDINRLDGRFKSKNTLAELDRFTSQYTLEELNKLIADSNMVSEKYLNGELRVISNNKQNHSVMTKEVLENIKEFKNSKDIIYANTKDILRGKFNDDLDKKFNEINLIQYIGKLKMVLGDSFIESMKNLQNIELQKLFLKKLFAEFLKVNNRGGVCVMIKSLPYEMGRKLMLVINHDIIMKRKMTNSRKLEKGNEI